MTAFSTARLTSKDWHGGNQLLPIVSAIAVAATALSLVAYLLWPTWGSDGASAPDRLPISVGGTLFNVPPAAIRMKIQRHSGPQERIDLDFSFPSLQPPEPPKHVGAEAIEDRMPPIDRIFLSIAAHRDTLAPDMRTRVIYPRYLEQDSMPGPDGLSLRAFRDATPYGGEDLFAASTPSLTARCTRDAATPGMCLSERRVDGADLTFRFPRSWLARWRDVAAAMDRLTLQLHSTK